MLVKNKKVLVYGMSLSGVWAMKLLIKKHAKVYVYDDNFNSITKSEFKKCYLLDKLNENIIADFDMIVVSPGVQSDNPNLIIAQKNNIPIYSELEFASSYVKNMIALTGTNGKTTTINLITNILNKQKRAIACGNIGYPVSRAIMEKKKGIYVIEVSSFMLEYADSFSPQVATVLNISPDHLIRHKTMEEYTRLKLSIFKNLTPNNYAVVNLDDNITPNLDAKTVTYSYKHNADVYIKNGYIYLHQYKIIALNELKLKGKHNVLNVMCAICFAYIYKIKPNKISETLKEFEPISFRNERIIARGVTFINDSKSTNIASTLASVDSVKNPIILLLGGSNKNLDYTELFDKLPKRVKKIFAFGEIADKLKRANNDKFDLKTYASLASAFKDATKNLNKNDVVILSPASASYDEFSSYIERGKYFNKLVQEYENSKT